MRTRKFGIKYVKFVIACCILSSSVFTTKAQSTFPEGEKLIKLGQLKTAKNYFINKTNDAQGCYYMGEIYYKLGNVDSAAIFYQKGLSINPNEYRNNLGLVKLAQEKGQMGEVLSNLNKATYNGRTKDVSALVGAAEALISNKKPDAEKAKEYLSKAMEINNKFPQIHMVTGEIEANGGNSGKAANEFETAIFYDSTNAEPYYKVGVIYSRGRNFQEAIKFFNKALAKDSNYIPVWKELAEVQLKYAKYPEASKSYSRYIKLTEPNYKDHNRFAFILFLNKEYAKSEEEAKYCLQIEPNDIYSKRIIAYNQCENKVYDKALASIQDYFKLVTKENTIAQDYEYYGKILTALNQDSLAILNYNIAIKMDSTKKQLYDNIGKSYDKLKKPFLALESYEKLLNWKKEPLLSEYFNLGKSYYSVAQTYTSPTDSLLKQKNALKADSVFERIASTAPNSYFGYFWRARANSLIDPSTTKAKPYFEKVISIIEPTDKNRKELTEAYQYMGVNLIKQGDFDGSRVYWDKILAIDPNDAYAKETIEKLPKKK